MNNNSRRDFIKKTAIATAGVAFLPDFIASSQAQLVEAMQIANTENKVLVVVQLSGGNDGLNCVVPFRNDRYYKARPKIAIPRDEVYEINDSVGFHPELKVFKDFYDEGILSVINGVGAQIPEKSHNKAMDMWQTAGGGLEVGSRTGWVGRFIDQSHGKKMYTALEIDDSLSLAMKGDKHKGLALIDPARTYNNLNNSFFKEIAKIREDAPEGSPLHFLYKTMSDSVASINHIYEKVKTVKTKTAFPLTQFGMDLRTVSELITSGIETKIYYVSLSGFDTHVDQLPKHEKILQRFSEGMKAFVKDLKANNKLKDVMIVAFSEFGRGVKENQSEGTDHGAANNVFLISGGLKKKGLYNAMPTLAEDEIQANGLVASVEFKSVYSTLLKHWLGANDTHILGKDYAYLDFI